MYICMYVLMYILVLEWTWAYTNILNNFFALSKQYSLNSLIFMAKPHDKIAAFLKIVSFHKKTKN